MSSFKICSVADCFSQREPQQHLHCYMLFQAGPCHTPIKRWSLIVLPWLCSALMAPLVTNQMNDTAEFCDKVREGMKLLPGSFATLTLGEAVCHIRIPIILRSLCWKGHKMGAILYSPSWAKLSFVPILYPIPEYGSFSIQPSNSLTPVGCPTI